MLAVHGVEREEEGGRDNKNEGVRQERTLINTYSKIRARKQREQNLSVHK